MSQLAKALIIDRIIYGIQVWGSTTAHNKQWLQVLVNQAAKIVLGASSYHISTPRMLSQLGWSGIDQLIDQHTLSMAVSVIQTGKPASLTPTTTSPDNEFNNNHLTQEI